MVETQAVSAHGFVERVFAGVAKGRMADVMYQRERFGEVAVQAKGGGDGARKLGDFDGVGEAATVMVGVALGEDLGFAGEAAEGSRMNDARAVALKGRAISVLRFRVLTRGESLCGVVCDSACRW